MFTGKYNNASYMTKENKGKSLTSATKDIQMKTTTSASKLAYKGLYSLVKHVYQDNGQGVTESFAFDKEALEMLGTKIMDVLIDDLPHKEKKSILN